LDKQPAYNILPPGKTDATFVNYAWFVVSIFSLEWAKTALANFEAAAVMDAWLAPRNASELFWHADMNWANPLWWPRFLWNCVYSAWHFKKSSNQNSPYNTKPSFLWKLLSIVSLVIFSAVPLSGLTMELSDVRRSSSRKASILGPGPDSYHEIGRAGLAQIVEGTWRLGGNATPPDASYFFAAKGTNDVSLTYFEDMARSLPGSFITAFLGPAVDEDVSGVAYGTNIDFYCRQVSSHDLKLVGGTDDPSTNYTVMFLPLDRYPDGEPTYGKPGYNSSEFKMIWLPEKDNGVGGTHPPYNMILAADGDWLPGEYGEATLEASLRGCNKTSDWLLPSDCRDRTPTALLELFLWQGEDLPDPKIPGKVPANDSVLQELLASESPLLQKGSSDGLRYVGFAVQCDVRSQLGYASIDPTRRTFANFSKSPALSILGMKSVFYPNMQAVMAVGDWGSDELRKARANEYRFDSIAQSIGLPAATKTYFSGAGAPRYPALTPENVAYSLYRLLGQSVIVPMGARSQDPWEGDLYVLGSDRAGYRGRLSWFSSHYGPF
jgi:hypothetical protein